MIKASKRSSGVSYAIRDLVVPAKELERKGYKILHLNIGDPNKYDFDTPPHMKEALYQATLRGENGYSPSEGYPELIESIIDREKKRNNVTYTREHICITSGVTESLQMFLNASLDPGDELLIPGPTYPQYRVITKFNDAEPIPYRCIEEEGWQPDIEDIRKRITKKTKAIVIINPNNPTGAVYPANVIKKIIDVAGEYNLPIISDEIYDDMTFDDNKQVATASLTDDVPIITFNGFSKVYLVPGWRIGYTLFHHNGELDEIEDAFFRIARSRLCANSVCQYACIQALKGPQDHIIEVNRKLKERRDFAYKRLNEIPGISTAKPEGAFYIFPKIEAIDGIWKTDKKFVLDLLYEKHVLVVNGSGFCPVFGKNHFRAVILPPLEMLSEALDRLEDFMRSRLS